MAGALLAARGQMNVAAVLLLGWSAAVLGDNIDYAIGRFGGRRLFLGRDRYVGIRPQDVQRMEHFFERWGGGMAIVARFFEGLRQLNGVVAGIGAMPWWRFFSYNVVGAAIWVGLGGGAAYYSGAKMAVVLTHFRRLEPYVLALPVLDLVILVVFLVRRRNAGNGP